MATPAEKKALLFLGIVALLGGGVRLWRSHRAAHHASFDASDASRTSSYSSGKSSSRKRTSSKKSSKRRSSNDRYGNVAAPLTVDLDVASAQEIEALGVVDAAIARMIVADRDSSGPFGSVLALKRIPYLSAATIRKLAPHVTFSRLPRPPNAVMQESQRRADSPKSARRRTR